MKQFFNTGNWNLWYNIQSLKLYRYVGGMGDFAALFDVIFIVVTLVKWYNVVKTATNNGS